MDQETYQHTYKFLNKFIHRVGQRLKKLTFPGFEGVPIYDVFWFFVKGIQKGSVNTRATSVAFNFLLALGPAIIFLLTLLPFLPISDFKHELFEILSDIIPSNSFIAIESLLNEIFQKRSGLQIFGFVVALFFAQKGIHGMIAAFNATYHIIETRPWIEQRLIAIALVFIVFTLVTAAAILLFFSRSVIEKLLALGIIESTLTFYLLQAGKWIIIIGMTFFAISFFYYLAPNRRTEWKFISAGSTFATILSILASLGFSYFVNNFAQFNRFFGSIGALMALMLWLNFNALALIIGFELNASINNAHLQISEPSEE